jgi:hypothetical protein
MAMPRSWWAGIFRPATGVRIITKTPALVDDTIEARHAQRPRHLAASLERLKVDAVYGLSCSSER